MKIIFTTVLVLISSTIIVNAQISFAKIFSDNMILQRNKPINIWGIAKPGSIVEISKGKITKNTKTKFDSTWSVLFNAEEANPYPQTIKLKSDKDSISIKNILIGDIWLCIGQSNMEWPMFKEEHVSQEKNNSNNDLLRWYNPTYAGKNTYNILFSDSIKANLNTANFYKGSWQQSDSTTFRLMSAVAYYFGKNIINKTHIPIGLINLSIGGAAIESFISEEAFASSKQFSNKLNSDWNRNIYLPNWIKERAMQNLGNISDNPVINHEKKHAFKPGFAFDAGIRPLTKIPIAGVLCYQGESNAQEIERVNEYGQLINLLVNDYRKKWKQPNLPFYYCQISSIDTLNYKSQLWPQFRNEQRKIQKNILYSGMAVTSDFGFKHDVHPTNKKIVGERLALIALAKTYQNTIIASGPEPIRAVYFKNKIMITFKNSSKKLQIANSNILHGFSLDSINEAEAIIDKNLVNIFVNKKPKFVYYGWQPFSTGNLINETKLPSSTFKIHVK